MMKESMSFDEGLNNLEAIVQRLESGQLNLDEALHEFENGIVLSKTLQNQLLDAQRRVELLKQNYGMDPHVVPLEGEAL